MYIVYKHNEDRSSRGFLPFFFKKNVCLMRSALVKMHCRINIRNASTASSKVKLLFICFLSAL